MKTVIERYNKVKEEHQLLDLSSEAKEQIQNKEIKEMEKLLVENAYAKTFWQGEAVMLRQQLQWLQQSHRQLLGEELSGLNVTDLQKMETKLVASLKGIRTKKEQVLMDELEDLHRKVNLIGQENKELHNKEKLLCQENTELQKAYGLWSTDEANRSLVPHMHCDNNGSHAPISLKLSQPQPQTNYLPTETIQLGLHLNSKAS